MGHADEVPSPLDGNAGAGLLRELFAFEMTAVSVTCAGCGMVAQVGELALYGGRMGVISLHSLRYRCDAISPHASRVPNRHARRARSFRACCSVGGRMRELTT